MHSLFKRGGLGYRWELRLVISCYVAPGKEIKNRFDNPEAGYSWCNVEAQVRIVDGHIRIWAGYLLDVIFYPGKNPKDYEEGQCFPICSTTFDVMYLFKIMYRNPAHRRPQKPTKIIESTGNLAVFVPDPAHYSGGLGNRLWRYIVKCYISFY